LQRISSADVGVRHGVDIFMFAVMFAEGIIEAIIGDIKDPSVTLRTIS